MLSDIVKLVFLSPTHICTCTNKMQVLKVRRRIDFEQNFYDFTATHLVFYDFKDPVQKEEKKLLQ